MSTQSPTVLTRDQYTVLPGPEGAPFVRRQCFDDGHVWMGEVTTEPGCASPWHHHGEYDTLIYCLEGKGRLEFADPELEPLDFAAQGTFVLIPKGVVHRELNIGDVPNRAIVFRVGSGPSVVPVPDPRAA